MISVQNVTKLYNGVAALRSVSLTIDRGETAVLIGPSGSGKSTLLDLLIGIETPDMGHVAFDGRMLTAETALSLRRRMGYVAQDGGLFPHLTARANVTLMAKENRWPAHRLTARLKEICALTRFPAEALDRYPMELSGGQSQRVSLMRALMLDPDVILLDEPLGALDPMIRAELQEDLKTIFQTLHKTVVLVTHDLSEACFLGDRIVLLSEGQIVQQGPFADLLAHPADDFVKKFVEAQLRRYETIKAQTEA